jgi:hypothetical protein
LAQGGTRVIQAGTIVQTPQGNSQDAIKFNTLYNAQIEDGEVLVQNVEVIASQPGIIGNVPAGAIKEVSGEPYVGAAATNPLPFTNGKPEEAENQLRERIKQAKASRSKGTSLALTYGVKGVSSKEDNKTVISANVLNRENEPSVLYIDDGTGYEESVNGVATETLTDSALGGEQIFQLSAPRPVTKAFKETTIIAPYALSAGNKLSVLVGGVLSEHTFVEADFNSISNATAYEVVASINSNPNLLFSARTSSSATKVVIFAKAEVNEDIAIVANDNDANTVLGFTFGTEYTLRLFKNNQLLYKDGLKAVIYSKSKTDWASSIVSGDTLIIKIDGLVAQTLTFTDSDFVNNGTGYTTVSQSNSLESWAIVFNSKLIGATTAASADKIYITSNLGASSRAAVQITGGTLVTKAMFDLELVTGINNDYSLNRNTGQFKLNTALSAGDSLIAATPYTRAYVESDEITGSVTLGSTANLWLTVDEGATMLSTGVTSATAIAVSTPGSGRIRYTASNGTFGSGSTPYVTYGDWMVIWDPQFTEKGIFRISNIEGGPNYSWIEVERDTFAFAPENKTPTSNGIVFSRSGGRIQKISISSGTYSLSALADAINSSLIGATASVYRNKHLRITTNSFDNGDIILVTADTQGQLLLIPTGELKENAVSHFPVIESLNEQKGTPGFQWTRTSGNGSVFSLTGNEIDYRLGDLFVFKKSTDVGLRRYGANVGNGYLAESISGIIVTPRIDSKSVDFLNGNERMYTASPFAITANDYLTLILDGDSLNKSYNINLFRNIRPDPAAIYGTAPFEVDDADNSYSSLFTTFGSSTKVLNDFAVYMKARGKSAAQTANKTILWRSAQYGAAGNKTRVALANPAAPNAVMAVSSDISRGYGDVAISFASGNARTTNISNVNSFYFTRNSGYTASASNVVRALNVVTVTLAPAGVTNCHTLAIGDVIYQLTDQTSGNVFRMGPKVVAAITANSFSYAEVGAAGASAVDISYVTSARAAGTSFTISAITSSGSQILMTIGTHNFSAGDTIYFEPGHFDPTSNIQVAAGPKVLSGVNATQVIWNEPTTAGSASLIPSVPYTISPGHAVKTTVLNYKPEIAAGSMSRTGSIVTAVLNNTNILNQHTLAVGDVVYLTPGEANFPAGPKIIASAAANVITYVESGAGASSAAVEYLATSPIDPNISANVIVGDVVHIDSNSSLPSDLDGNHTVTAVASNKFSFWQELDTVPVPTAYKVNDANNILFYPITAITAANLVTWANANASNYVTAALVPHNGGVSNNGSATYSVATKHEYFTSTSNTSAGTFTNVSVIGYPLYDGLNWVKTTQLDGANSKISFKNSVENTLTSNADFANENFRLVPVTTQNLVDFLNNTFTGSGFVANGLATSSHDGQNLQLYSRTSGNDGKIQITGGTGNLATAQVVGAASLIDTVQGQFLVPTNQVSGFAGENWVSLQASNLMPKATAFASGTTIEFTSQPQNTTLVEFTGAGSSVVNVIQSFTSAIQFQIEKNGKYMAFVDYSSVPNTLSANIKEGDYVNISCASMSAANQGLRRVVRTYPIGNTFWIEANGVEELVALNGTTDYIHFLTADSAVPGDTLIIGTNAFGNSVQGEHPITAYNVSDALSFSIEGQFTTGPTAFGTNFDFIKIKSGDSIKFVRKITTIIPSSENAGYSNVLIDIPYPSTYINKITETAGYSMTALDKLNFDTQIVAGINGYTYNTGLLAEVNKVAFGDETNSSVYPGIVATGTKVIISGPLIKRIPISVLLRLRTGVVEKDIVNRVRSAIASVINSAEVGESIALSDIIAVANGIDGVLAVTILSPDYTTGDLIPVQSNEKPRVLDISTDVLVSVVN